MYDPSMKLLVTLEPDETGTIVAECPAIPGCVSQRRTEAEALENIREGDRGLPGSVRGKSHVSDDRSPRGGGSYLVAALPSVSGGEPYEFSRKLDESKTGSTEAMSS